MAEKTPALADQHHEHCLDWFHGDKSPLSHFPFIHRRFQDPVTPVTSKVWDVVRKVKLYPDTTDECWEMGSGVELGVEI